MPDSTKEHASRDKGGKWKKGTSGNLDGRSSRAAELRRVLVGDGSKKIQRDQNLGSHSLPYPMDT